MEKSLSDNITPRPTFAQMLREPIFAPIMAQRVLARAIVGAAAAYLTLSAIGVSVWRCPVREVLGVACPGCGLTRAAMLLLRGHVRESLEMHLYAPLLLSALVLLLCAALLPREYSRRLTEAVARLEKSTSLGALALLLLPVYWILRLILHTAPL
jgi:hypothetical protein